MGLLIAYCFGVYFLAGLGASIGYHRILTHKSAVLPKWLEYTIVFLGLPAGTPVQWVGNHRAHHKFTDKKGDPHSPLLSGFWYAHCGWYIGTNNKILCLLYTLAGPLRMFIDSFIRPRSNLQYNAYAKDIEKHSFYRFLSNPWAYNGILLIYLFALIALFWSQWEWQGIIALWLSLIIVYNLGDAVNSFGHLYGKRKSDSNARNNMILGWLSFGDGWHANHHQKPSAARHGMNKSQFDLSHLILTFFKKIKLVSKIQDS